MKKSGLFIIGAGGHAGEVLAYLEALNSDEIELMGAIDDGKPIGTWRTTKVLGGIESLPELISESAYKHFFFITAVGDNLARKQIVEKIESLELTALSPWTLSHPCASIGTGVEVGTGTLLAPASFITTHAMIGKHCILNIKSSVSHDSTIGDFVNLNPGSTILGRARIGTGAFIGAGAIVLPGVSVGDWATVGAGAVVTKDLPPKVTAVGVPAKIIKKS